ncbi:MAG: hypothetical protein JSU65_06680 [Candidatus Zixiibacteriota bacterium]|nr:MAG: hypothetical protein JSU65_06680 [candidate division Zixibacteria bacterium]
MSKLFSMEYFPSLTSNEEFLARLTDEKHSGWRILNQHLLLSTFSFIYGVVMGSYHSFLQAVTTGLKVSLLFTAVLLICFPAFFIIQYILGSRLGLRQMISVVLSGFVLTTAIMVSFAPIIVIFLLTGSNYHFLQLLHVAVFVLSGLFGMKTIVDALRFSCERKNVYPRVGVVVFRFWVVILAFVGIQLAWNLRPFLGDRGQPFELFREYEGNFYTALIYSVKQLVKPEEKPEAPPVTNKDVPHYDVDSATADSLLEAFRRGS